MMIRHRFTSFLLLFFIVTSYSLQADQACQTAQTSVSFSSKTRTVGLEDLSIHTMLSTIHDNINRELEYITNAQKTAYESGSTDTLQKLDPQMQVLVTLQKFFDETNSLFSYIVHNVINAGVFKFNPDIEYKFINTYNCINLSEAVQPRHLRLLKTNIDNLNKYISDYCLIRKDYLSPQETIAFGAIAKLNNFMLDCILKDEFMGIDYWDRLADNCFYRPLEWVCANKRFVIFVSALTIGLILYYHFSICKPRTSTENNNAKLDVIQFNVVDQEGNVCAYHTYYNVGILLSENNINELKKKLTDKQSLQKLLPKNKKNYELDAQDVEELLIKKNPLKFKDRVLNKMVIIPAIDPLENISDRDELLITLGANITSSDFIDQIDTFKKSGKGGKIGFIINTGRNGNGINSDSVDTKNTISHWIGAVFTKDPKSKRGFSVAVTNSLRNEDVTNDSSINLIAEKLLQ